MTDSVFGGTLNPNQSIIIIITSSRALLDAGKKQQNTIIK